MTTYQPMSLIFESLTADRISEGTLAYFRERFKNKLHAVVLQQFIEQESARGMSKADIARKLGKDPAQVTRWLKTPGNITINSVSDLLLALGAEPHIDCHRLIDHDAESDRLPDWFSDSQQQTSSRNIGGARSMTLIHNAETSTPNVDQREPLKRGLSRDEINIATSWKSHA